MRFGLNLRFDLKRLNDAQLAAFRKPTHSVYFVKGTGKDANWVRIGAAWIHDDGEGLNISLDRFVVRANKTDAQEEAAQ